MATNSPTIHPVVLCGGSGTRLWPKSRKAKPKPFLPLVSDRTLLEATLDRWLGAQDFAEPIIVAGHAHLPHLSTQASAQATLIVEPAAKNTAPAIALAATLLRSDSVLLVCPSDHHIADTAAFTAAARTAAQLATENWMVAFGIAASHPDTGYGYIRIGAPIKGGHLIEQFVEKPDRETAQRFLADGGYAWNGGIFAFRAGVFMDELERHRPAMAEAVRKSVVGGHYSGQEFHPDPEAFSGIAGESVDYAVMENTERAAVVSADMGWSDIGNWEALRDARPAGDDGNRCYGPAELIDCRNVLVETDGPRVSVIGLDDVIVVVDGDEVLVTSAAGAQLVGKLEGAANQ